MTETDAARARGLPNPLPSAEGPADPNPLFSIKIATRIPNSEVRIPPSPHSAFRLPHSAFPAFPIRHSAFGIRAFPFPFRLPHSCIPHFRPFRIPHSAFRIPHSHSAFRIPHFRIPTSAFALPAVRRKGLPWAASGCHGMTLTEKILARASGRARVEPGDNVWVETDVLHDARRLRPGHHRRLQARVRRAGQGLGSRTRSSSSRTTTSSPPTPIEPQCRHPARLRAGAGPAVFL